MVPPAVQPQPSRYQAAVPPGGSWGTRRSPVKPSWHKLVAKGCPQAQGQLQAASSPEAAEPPKPHTGCGRLRPPRSHRLAQPATATRPLPPLPAHHHPGGTTNLQPPSSKRSQPRWASNSPPKTSTWGLWWRQGRRTICASTSGVLSPVPRAGRAVGGTARGAGAPRCPMLPLAAPRCPSLPSRGFLPKAARTKVLFCAPPGAAAPTDRVKSPTQEMLLSAAKSQNKPRACSSRLPRAGGMCLLPGPRGSGARTRRGSPRERPAGAAQAPIVRAPSRGGGSRGARPRWLRTRASPLPAGLLLPLSTPFGCS